MGKFNIGDLLEDKVTGFTGIAMAVTLYATGCIHYGLASKKLKTDGGTTDWEWFDENRLKLKKKKVIKFKLIEDINGGPEQNPPQM